MAVRRADQHSERRALSKRSTTRLGKGVGVIRRWCVVVSLMASLGPRGRKERCMATKSSKERDDQRRGVLFVVSLDS